MVHEKCQKTLTMLAIQWIDLKDILEEIMVFTPSLGFPVSNSREKSSVEHTTSKDGQVIENQQADCDHERSTHIDNKQQKRTLLKFRLRLRRWEIQSIC